jgi:hypothetical protein
MNHRAAVMLADFSGEKNNLGSLYLRISRIKEWWKTPKRLPYPDKGSG